VGSESAETSSAFLEIPDTAGQDRGTRSWRRRCVASSETLRGVSVYVMVLATIGGQQSNLRFDLMDLSGIFVAGDVDVLDSKRGWDSDSGGADQCL